MIFSELYSAYYNTVAQIIASILDGEHSEKELQKIVVDCAFGESALTILPSLKSGKWQLVHSRLTTNLVNKPTLPLTTLQKRWLKAISLDPRVRLFDVKFPNLSDVEPLFTSEDYYVYDKYGDGDPYNDKNYVKQFRCVLNAIRNKQWIKFQMENRQGKTMYVRCRPLRLEYSEKDDKFRVITTGQHNVSTVNLAKIRACVPYIEENRTAEGEKSPKYATLTVKVTDERNALERFMLHFAHFEKQAEQIDNKHYLVTIKYALDDKSEMVIRILSFGPMVEVLAPQSFKNLIIAKLINQKNCGLV